ncbi:MAG TPA: glycerophosphodiester phosphodiesterase family protein [Lacunisphaera sp.]
MRKASEFRSSWNRLGMVLLGAALVLSGAAADTAPAVDRGAAIASAMADGRATNVLVVAHRSDWRSHPENSLRAMRSAIAMGVDVIEVDVRRTKDGRFVIIHDTTLDRSTTGEGRVSDFTLAELRQLRLRDGLGSPTEETIPTLEEALDAARGRVVINLDKSAEHPAEIFQVVERENALGYALFSVTQPLPEFEQSYPGLLAKIPHFMLVVSDTGKNCDALIGPYLAQRKPDVLQIVFSREDRPALDWVERARAAEVRVWFNALWPHHNAGHNDDRALTDPEGAYGWLVARGATMIQTDRPRLLMEYLHRAGRKR